MIVSRVIILAFLVTVAYSALSFEKNVTVQNDNEFKYRATTYGLWNFLVWNGAWFGSFDSSVTPTEASVDAIWANAYVGTGSPPNSWLAHFNANAKYGNILQLAQQGNKANWADLDVSGVAGFVGQAYTKLEQIDASGAVVGNPVYLKDLLWVPTADSGARDNIYWATFKGTPLINPNNFDVQITVATSSVVGQLGDEWLNTVLTPKSLETFVKITNFPFSNTENKLRLTLGVATADANLDAKGVISAGSGDSKTYYAINSKVNVDGNIEDGTVGRFVEADITQTFVNPDFVAQIQKAFNGTAKAYITTVDLPQGARILLDPTIGSGDQPVVTGSAVSITVSLVVALFAMIMFIF